MNIGGGGGRMKEKKENICSQQCHNEKIAFVAFKWSVLLRLPYYNITIYRRRRQFSNLFRSFSCMVIRCTRQLSVVLHAFEQTKQHFSPSSCLLKQLLLILQPKTMILGLKKSPFGLHLAAIFFVCAFLPADNISYYCSKLNLSLFFAFEQK